ncbi:hypothetical protein BGHDH14_bgh06849 [Blumeria hordei DH14]|uniref:SUZ domain-containing protein n=1 Tax=Blumeria graminis f. sp. hordei (strain DH14) TaxID=546991 RepID=N1JFA1_BLUG1|nr:hypothetical protein BGHDH14_bgh06849 [Blumeria hordei DH14]
MSRKLTVPDAWDDDWESQVDAADDGATLEQPERITKAERLAEHAERNKKLWNAAEDLKTFHYLAARDNVPLKCEFKPALKVLSRNPAPRMVERLDPATGLSSLVLENDHEDKESKAQPTAGELKLKAQRDREEKQKRYDAARARILGSKDSTSHENVLGNPLRSNDAVPAHRGNQKNKAGGRSYNNHEDPRLATQTTNKGLLYDPNHTSSAGVPASKRNGGGLRCAGREYNTIIREPRGPNESGFGFSKRGGRSC